MDQLQPDVLQLVFDKLPAEEACVTVGCVCRAWHSAAGQHRQQHPQDPSAAPLLPLWYSKELWDSNWPLRTRDELARAASAHDQVAALQHAFDRGRTLNPLRVSCFLAQYGSLAALQWLHQRFNLDDVPHLGDVPLVICGSHAVRGGHLSVLQCLQHIGCSPCRWSASACRNAAGAGHLSSLQWLRDNGCPWSEETCSSAAGGGHLAVLQWACANGCPWGTWTCSAAARGGHLAVLQWARANGCPWYEETCSEAETSGHLAVLEWAYDNGCPCDRKDCGETTTHRDVEQWCLAMMGKAG